VLVIGAMIASLTVAWTGGAGAATKAASTSSSGCTASRVGGQITFGQQSIAPTIDPAMRNTKGSGGADAFAAVYDTLLRFDTKTGKVVPWVASSVTNNPTFTQYTLKLRPGLKFGNGDPFNAAAVVASQNRGLKNSFAGYANFIKSITAVDPTTVQYDLSTPWTELPVQLTQMFGMVADTAVIDRLGATAFASAVNAGAGVGPYEVTAFNAPNSITMKAKSDYWGGPVCIQQVTFVQATDPSQSLDSFDTGQYDMTVLRDPVLFQKWKTAKPRVGHDFDTLVVGASNLFINAESKSAHLDDPRVRQALQYATDVNTINQRGYQGTLVAHTSLVPKGQLLKETKPLPYDLAKAKQLLNQVKSETGWDGSMTLVCANGSSDQGVALQAVYDNAGFKINLNYGMDTTQFVTKVLLGHQYDIACGGMQAYNGDYWDSLYVRTFAPVNYSDFHNDEWNAGFAALAAAPFGSAAYQTAINKLQTLQNQLQPQVIYGSFPEATLMQNKVQGVLFSLGDIPLLGQAYLTKK
jgi:peptide/nickel transport system substrate-binding protein